MQIFRFCLQLETIQHLVEFTCFGEVNLKTNEPLGEVHDACGQGVLWTPEGEGVVHLGDADGGAAVGASLR